MSKLPQMAILERHEILSTSLSFLSSFDPEFESSTIVTFGMVHISWFIVSLRYILTVCLNKLCGLLVVNCDAAKKISWTTRTKKLKIGKWRIVCISPMILGGWCWIGELLWTFPSHWFPFSLWYLLFHVNLWKRLILLIHLMFAHNFFFKNSLLNH